MIWSLLLISAWALPHFLHGDGNQIAYPPSTFEEVPVILDGNFVPFWFGEAGTWAFQTFTVRATNNFSFYVFDCFCPGDSFTVFNNGELLGEVGNSFCFPNDDTCFDFSRSAIKCFNSPSIYCRRQFPMTAGVHNFTIYVSASPYGYGQGFFGAF